jgi:predicted  nucleic acid-binding Zn-ribbon protein
MDKTISLETQLKSLYKLQIIDSRIDNLQNIKGELPMEVSDLEDEIVGLETRIENINSLIEQLKLSIEERKLKINESNTLLLKYESQQMHVKNNREYVAITKEMELQKLEIMACEKKIKEYKTEIDEKEGQKKASVAELDERKKELVEKKRELTEIISETETQEDELKAVKKEAEKDIEERLLKAYTKIRNNYKNGLGVVTIDREACGGCFSQVPPQRQLDIRLSLKIIICENCGRILVDQKIASDVGDLVNEILES